jgi:hypothetical protein|tara:strand:+ start:654 stop:2018 length:1365 start_codon:yes stop_codon:yes gene_type:complete
LVVLALSIEASFAAVPAALVLFEIIDKNYRIFLLTTELYTNRIPFLYAQFSDTIGEQHWKRRVRKCLEAIKGNPLLDDVLRDENRIAFQLDRLSQILAANMWPTLPQEDARELYQSATFMAQTLSLAESLDNVQSARLIRRIHGAFKNPDDMRALDLELAVATHFTRAGLGVEWQESGAGKGFDLLVDPGNGFKFEVECKSISTDKGRKIHQHEARDFFRLVDLALKDAKFVPEGGISMVLTIDDRLPTAYKIRLELAKRVAAAMKNKSSVQYPEDVVINVKEFDPVRLQTLWSSDRDKGRALVDEITESPNCNSLIRQNSAGHVTILTIKSLRDDNFVHAVFETMKDAASEQFSKQRAAVLMVELFGIDNAQMLQLEEQDRTDTPTSLRVRASQFLDSRARQHIAQVYFSSRQSFSQRSDTSFTSNATTYFFENRGSLFWNDRLSTLFDGLQS